MMILFILILGVLAWEGYKWLCWSENLRKINLKQDQPKELRRIGEWQIVVWAVGIILVALAWMGLFIMFLYLVGNQ